MICSDLLNYLRSVGTIVATESVGNRKWLKQFQSHFHWSILYKSHHFSRFWCIVCTATPNISSSNKNINNTARVSRLFPFLMAMFKTRSSERWWKKRTAVLSKIDKTFPFLFFVCVLCFTIKFANTDLAKNQIRIHIALKICNTRSNWYFLYWLSFP